MNQADLRCRNHNDWLWAIHMFYDRVMLDPRSSMLISAFAPIPGGWFTIGTERGQEDAAAASRPR